MNKNILNNQFLSFFVVVIFFSILSSCTATSNPIKSICIDELLTHSPFAAGTGSNEDPYFICSPAQLNEVKNFKSSSFKLQADIDLSDFSSGEGWQPIGTVADKFSGNFDGNDKTISNLTINRPTEDNVGLFGVLADGAKISNVVVSGSVIGASDVGGLVGSTNTTLATVISRVSFTGTVTGANYVGGLFGFLYGSTLNKSWANVTVIATDQGEAGGLIGGMISGKVENCYALGSVTGLNYIGGLTGYYSNDDGFDSSMTIFKNSFVRVNLIRPSGVATYFGYFVGVVDIAPMHDSGNYYLLSASVTGGVTPQSDHATGLADADFTNSSSFSGWDFDTVWDMGESYPTLK